MKSFLWAVILMSSVIVVVGCVEQPRGRVVAGNLRLSSGEQPGPIFEEIENISRRYDIETPQLKPVTGNHVAIRIFGLCAQSAVMSIVFDPPTNTILFSIQEDEIPKDSVDSFRKLLLAELKTRGSLQVRFYSDRVLSNTHTDVAPIGLAPPPLHCR